MLNLIPNLGCEVESPIVFLLLGDAFAKNQSIYVSLLNLLRSHSKEHSFLH